MKYLRKIKNETSSIQIEKSGVPGFKYFSLELWREFDLFNVTIKLPENGCGSAGVYPFLEIPILGGIEVRYKCTFIYSNNII